MTTFFQILLQNIDLVICAKDYKDFIIKLGVRNAEYKLFYCFESVCK